MRTAFESLLRLYPTPFRDAYAIEMADVFSQATDDERSRGLLHYLAFVFAEFAGVFAAAFAMWTGEGFTRAQRRWSAPLALSVFTGLAITVLQQGCFYVALTKQRMPMPQGGVLSPAPDPEILAFLALVGICFVIISVLSIAFVWNMRLLGTRANRQFANGRRLRKSTDTQRRDS